MRTLLFMLLLAGPAFAQTVGVTEDSNTRLPDMSTPADELPSEEFIDGGIVVEELQVNRSEDIAITRPREVPLVRVATAPGAVLRGLDKISGDVVDLDLNVGESEGIGRLTVELGECRYPAENPSGDAYAFVTVMAEGLEDPAFEGWMIASSPALSALDHPRYDVWVIRCKSS